MTKYELQTVCNSTSVVLVHLHVHSDVDSSTSAKRSTAWYCHAPAFRHSATPITTAHRLNPPGPATLHHPCYRQNLSLTQQPMSLSSPMYGWCPSVRWQCTEWPLRAAAVAMDVSPACMAMGAPRRTQQCGGPSLAGPASCRGCGAHCLHRSVVVAEGRTRGRLEYGR